MAGEAERGFNTVINMKKYYDLFNKDTPSVPSSTVMQNDGSHDYLAPLTDDHLAAGYHNPEMPE